MKILRLQLPKRTTRGKPPATHQTNSNTLENPNALVARLAELHSSHQSIGPLLFGIKYAQQIADCPDSVKEIVRLSGVPGGYITDVQKGMKLASHVSSRS